jgi:hypothetical protein
MAHPLLGNTLDIETYGDVRLDREACPVNSYIRPIVARAAM